MGDIYAEKKKEGQKPGVPGIGFVPARRPPTREEMAADLRDAYARYNEVAGELRRYSLSITVPAGSRTVQDMLTQADRIEKALGRISLGATPALAGRFSDEAERISGMITTARGEARQGNIGSANAVLTQANAQLSGMGKVFEAEIGLLGAELPAGMRTGGIQEPLLDDIEAALLDLGTRNEGRGRSILDIVKLLVAYSQYASAGSESALGMLGPLCDLINKRGAEARGNQEYAASGGRKGARMEYSPEQAESDRTFLKMSEDMLATIKAQMRAGTESTLVYFDSTLNLFLQNVADEQALRVGGAIRSDVDAALKRLRQGREVSRDEVRDLSARIAELPKPPEERLPFAMITDENVTNARKTAAELRLAATELRGAERAPLQGSLSWYGNLALQALDRADEALQRNDIIGARRGTAMAAFILSLGTSSAAGRLTTDATAAVAEIAQGKVPASAGFRNLNAELSRERARSQLVQLGNEITELRKQTNTLTLETARASARENLDRVERFRGAMLDVLDKAPDVAALAKAGKGFLDAYAELLSQMDLERRKASLCSVATGQLDLNGQYVMMVRGDKGAEAVIAALRESSRHLENAQLRLHEGKFNEALAEYGSAMDERRKALILRTAPLTKPEELGPQMESYVRTQREVFRDMVLGLVPTTNDAYERIGRRMQGAAVIEMSVFGVPTIPTARYGGMAGLAYGVPIAGVAEGLRPTATRYADMQAEIRRMVDAGDLKGAQEQMRQMMREIRSAEFAGEAGLSIVGVGAIFIPVAGVWISGSIFAAMAVDRIVTAKRKTGEVPPGLWAMLGLSALPGIGVAGRALTAEMSLARAFSEVGVAAAGTGGFVWMGTSTIDLFEKAARTRDPYAREAYMQEALLGSAMMVLPLAAGVRGVAGVRGEAFKAAWAKVQEHLSNAKELLLQDRQRLALDYLGSARGREDVQLLLSREPGGGAYAYLNMPKPVKKALSWRPKRKAKAEKAPAAGATKQVENVIALAEDPVALKAVEDGLYGPDGKSGIINRKPENAAEIAEMVYKRMQAIGMTTDLKQRCGTILKVLYGNAKVRAKLRPELESEIRRTIDESIMRQDHTTKLVWSYKVSPARREEVLRAATSLGDNDFSFIVDTIERQSPSATPFEATEGLLNLSKGTFSQKSRTNLLLQRYAAGQIGTTQLETSLVATREAARGKVDKIGQTDILPELPATLQKRIRQDGGDLDAIILEELKKPGTADRVEEILKTRYSLSDAQAVQVRKAFESAVSAGTLKEAVANLSDMTANLTTQLTPTGKIIGAEKVAEGIAKSVGADMKTLAEYIGVEKKRVPDAEQRFEGTARDRTLATELSDIKLLNEKYKTVQERAAGVMAKEATSGAPLGVTEPVKKAVEHIKSKPFTKHAEAFMESPVSAVAAPLTGPPKFIYYGMKAAGWKTFRSKEAALKGLRAGMKAVKLEAIVLPIEAGGATLWAYYRHRAGEEEVGEGERVFKKALGREANVLKNVRLLSDDNAKWVLKNQEKTSAFIAGTPFWMDAYRPESIGSAMESVEWRLLVERSDDYLGDLRRMDEKLNDVNALLKKGDDDGLKNALGKMGIAEKDVKEAVKIYLTMTAGRDPVKDAKFKVSIAGKKDAQLTAEERNEKAAIDTVDRQTDDIVRGMSFIDAIKKYVELRPNKELILNDLETLRANDWESRCIWMHEPANTIWHYLRDAGIEEAAGTPEGFRNIYNYYRKKPEDFLGILKAVNSGELPGSKVKDVLLLVAGGTALKDALERNHIVGTGVNEKGETELRWVSITQNSALHALDRRAWMEGDPNLFLKVEERTGPDGKKTQVYVPKYTIKELQALNAFTVGNKEDIYGDITLFEKIAKGELTVEEARKQGIAGPAIFGSDRDRSMYTAGAENYVRLFKDRKGQFELWLTTNHRSVMSMKGLLGSILQDTEYQKSPSESAAAKAATEHKKDYEKLGILGDSDKLYHGYPGMLWTEKPVETQKGFTAPGLTEAGAEGAQKAALTISSDAKTFYASAVSMLGTGKKFETEVEDLIGEALVKEKKAFAGEVPDDVKNRIKEAVFVQLIKPLEPTPANKELEGWRTTYWAANQADQKTKLKDLILRFGG